ncbi:hypothetical protein BBFGKLBO_01754 [Synechococcus sp. CBW1107]|uniref:hypothetical protein n=2 Tax=Synechococcus sp. CBW1107 TaxID=2789857 RepID=UPI001E359449|nr:hypothetical protein [Synechococcus sp. CBW1107]CAK6694987.1 hypothetical protein BBFGKLBO_01754 [Synechococcus sp. CBW1107]
MEAFMHTHDLENHDNLYAEDMPIRGRESAMEARSHVSWAVIAMAVMVAVLAGVAAMGQGGPLG